MYGPCRARSTRDVHGFRRASPVKATRRITVDTHRGDVFRRRTCERCEWSGCTRTARPSCAKTLSAASGSSCPRTSACARRPAGTSPGSARSRSSRRVPCVHARSRPGSGRGSPSSRWRRPRGCRPTGSSDSPTRCCSNAPARPTSPSVPTRSGRTDRTSARSGRSSRTRSGCTGTTTPRRTGTPGVPTRAGGSSGCTGAPDVRTTGRTGPSPPVRTAARSRPSTIWRRRCSIRTRTASPGPSPSARRSRRKRPTRPPGTAPR